MSTEANKALFRRFIEEVVNHGNMVVADEIMAPDFAEHEELPPQIPRNREGVKQLFTMLRSGLPDMQVIIEDEIAEGDRVVFRLLFRGTHQGTFMGIPPTGRQVSYEVIDIARIADGKLVEHWGLSDNLSFLQQLGAIPQPG
jgi:predicted ester cyclase